MPTLSDLIERHLNALVEAAENSQVEVIRSELATIFDCVPSQINYVLTTRFTPAKGFVVESQRGSGGHVRIRRVLIAEKSSLGEYLHTGIAPELSHDPAMHICERLHYEGLITAREAALMMAALRRSSLPLPVPLRDQVRAAILKAMLLEIAGWPCPQTEPEANQSS